MSLGQAEASRADRSNADKTKLAVLTKAKTPTSISPQVKCDREGTNPPITQGRPKMRIVAAHAAV